MTSPRALVGGDEQLGGSRRRTQWGGDVSDGSSGSVADHNAMEPGDLRQRDDEETRDGDVRSKKALEKAGTLKIKDVDTGEEFIMHKSEASALLTTHHSSRKIVKDAATGTSLTVNEFGSRAGLPDQAPPVTVHARGTEKSLKNLRRIQTLGSQEGAVWAMQFNANGSYLATAGQDRVVRVWKTFRSGKLRGEALFEDAPVRAYTGHRGDILDLCWSHTDWLLSSSMDKTVRLWYTTMDECLRIFTHQDFVTSIKFNPVNDKFFISGSLDGKLRMWNIPDLKVVDWVDIGEMVTSCTFSSCGRRAVVGTHKGKCHFYGTDSFKFKYSHQIQVKNARGSKLLGRKITGLNFMPADDEQDELLVTANDSRLRLYDGSAVLQCKYKGHSNQNAQIQASYSTNGEYIVSGSESPDVFIWRAHCTTLPACACGGGATAKQSTYEKFTTSEQHVTVARFGPDDLRTTRAFPLEELSGTTGQIILAAGYSGKVHVYENV